MYKYYNLLLLLIETSEEMLVEFYFRTMDYKYKQKQQNNVEYFGNLFKETTFAHLLYKT